MVDLDFFARVPLDVGICNGGKCLQGFYRSGLNNVGNVFLKLLLSTTAKNLLLSMLPKIVWG